LVDGQISEKSYAIKQSVGTEDTKETLSLNSTKQLKKSQNQSSNQKKQTIATQECQPRDKKKIWNDAHDITIHGHEAELYVEDAERPPVSAGMYSLLTNTWLKRPSYSPPDIDDSAINHKVQSLIKQIDAALQSPDADDIRRVSDKIRHMRRSGLDTAGEFGTENLAFKILRNQGYLNQLSKEYIRKQDMELSI
jgi:hypothetical protein